MFVLFFNIDQVHLATIGRRNVLRKHQDNDQDCFLSEDDMCFFLLFCFATVNF